MNQATTILTCSDEQKVKNIAHEADVVHASNGYAALEKILEFVPDVVLLDISMPNLDGCEFLRIVKSKPDFSEIPIIVISSNPAEYGEMRSAFPNTHFFKKPITDKLFRVILSYTLHSCPPDISESSHKIHLDRYLGGDPKAQHDLIKIFYDYTPERIVELDSFYRQGNNRLMLDWCHGMKGTAAVLGAHNLLVCINELVEVLLLPDSPHLGKHIEFVIDEMRSTAVKLHKLFPACNNYR